MDQRLYIRIYISSATILVLSVICLCIMRIHVNNSFCIICDIQWCKRLSLMAKKIVIGCNSFKRTYSVCKQITSHAGYVSFEHTRFTAQ